MEGRAFFKYLPVFEKWSKAKIMFSALCRTGCANAAKRRDARERPCLNKPGMDLNALFIHAQIQTPARHVARCSS